VHADLPLIFGICSRQGGCFEGGRVIDSQCRSLVDAIGNHLKLTVQSEILTQCHGDQSDSVMVAAATPRRLRDSAAVNLNLKP